jgi:hypothetical protein
MGMFTLRLSTMSRAESVRTRDANRDPAIEQGRPSIGATLGGDRQFAT